MKTKIKLICCLLAILVPLSFFSVPIRSENANTQSLGIDCKSAVLMEAATGEIIYSMNESEPLPPASVTKVMTLLLVMEAIENKRITLDDMVSASENACSMGGSQIFLEPGEQMSVDDLLKSVVIASANDAAVALAEHVCGSESAFVELMNKRAAELGMTGTRFENTNGLDDTTTEHLTSAKDIAIMSRELIKHKKILEYSCIWMDTIRNGAFGLTNTNRLIRFYKGATGLKTGSTSKAGFCITATAERDGMTLIAVIMGSPSRDARNAAAVTLLNYGFSNYALFSAGGVRCGTVAVRGGKTNTCEVLEQPIFKLIEKQNVGKVERVVQMSDALKAPVALAEEAGTVTYKVGDKVIGTTKILTTEPVERVDFADIFVKILKRMCFCA